MGREFIKTGFSPPSENYMMYPVQIRMAQCVAGQFSDYFYDGVQLFIKSSICICKPCHIGILLLSHSFLKHFDDVPLNTICCLLSVMLCQSFQVMIISTSYWLFNSKLILNGVRISLAVPHRLQQTLNNSLKAL